MKNKRSKNLRERGITLIALVITIVVLLILAGVTITLMFGENSIFDLAKDAANKTNEAIKSEQSQIDELNKWLTENGWSSENGGSGEDPKDPENPDVPPTPEEPSLKPSNDEENIEGVTFSTAYGKIDIIWLDGTSNTPSSINIPNSPANYLNGMTPIKWNETTETSSTITDTDWYNYEPATGTTDSKTSHWANAKTTNGSYFVWIPRYAYRITYYDKDPNTDNTAQITGYYDGYGMWKAETGELKCKLETGVETILNYNDKSYIVHPAFTTNLDVGGWSENLPGFWFAKYEMSGNGSAKLASVSGVSNITTGQVGALYLIARDATYGMTGTKDTTDNNTSFMYSHMAKNSEWGAVAFLTHSSYGRNGFEIDMNKGGAATFKLYTDQSTTGNIYGVYSMRGGANEYTATFNKESTSLSNGSSFASNGGVSTKYATSYENKSEVGSGTPTVQTVCKTGDGIKEVWVSGETGWFSDFTKFSYSNRPFFLRGGGWDVAEDTSGVFYSSNSAGTSVSTNGFRTVLCP